VHNNAVTLHSHTVTKLQIRAGPPLFFSEIGELVRQPSALMGMPVYNSDKDCCLQCDATPTVRFLFLKWLLLALFH
jgi:hypothetical protein